jgi:hypothetical protein
VKVPGRQPLGVKKRLEKRRRIAGFPYPPFKSVPLEISRTGCPFAKCSQFVVRNLTKQQPEGLAMVEHDVSSTTAVDRRPQMCQHTPPCPSFSEADREAAHVISAHPEQGWSLLCNGVIVFDDTGELLPDGRCIAPARPEPCHAAA